MHRHTQSDTHYYVLGLLVIVSRDLSQAVGSSPIFILLKTVVLSTA